MDFDLVAVRSRTAPPIEEGDMRVAEAMQRSVTTIGEDQSLSLAFQVMVWSRIRHLPVLRRGVLVGMLSERDIFERGRVRGSVFHIEGEVGDAMSSPVATAAPDDAVEDVALRMAEGRIGCVPVVEHGALVGILTTTDLLYLSAEPPLPERWANLPARALTTGTPESVHPDDRLLDAAARMARRRVRHLPVVDGEGRALGMLSDREVRSALGDAWSNTEQSASRFPARVAALRVEDVMAPGGSVVTETDSAMQVVGRMLSSHHGALPVVDGEGHVVGVISYVDVLRELSAASP
jgi:CBS domain-containing protein